MTERKRSAAEATADSVGGAITLLWDWLTKEPAEPEESDEHAIVLDTDGTEV